VNLDIIDEPIAPNKLPLLNNKYQYLNGLESPIIKYSYTVDNVDNLPKTTLSQF